MKKFGAIGALVCFLAAATLLAGCFGGAVEGVRVAEVTRGDVSKVVSAVGTLQASRPVDVVPLVGATIVSLPVKEGDYVNAGDVLCTLDEKELAEQAAQAEANYLTSASIGDILEGSYSGMAGLYESLGYAAEVFGEIQGQIDEMVLSFYDIVPAFISCLPPDEQQHLNTLLAEQREKYLQAVSSRPAAPRISSPGYSSNAAAADAARTEAARYEYERVAQGTKSPNLLAPVSGYVVFVAPQKFALSDVLTEMLGGLGSLSSSLGSLAGFLGGDLSSLLGGGAAGGSELAVGSRLTAGQPAFKIVDLQDMKVAAQVEEVDIPQIKQGQCAQIYLDAYPDLTFAGEVVQVGVKAETGSAGTTVFPVTVQMDRTEIPLRLGYNATVDIEVLGKTGVIAVPATALIEEGGVFVYVVVDGKAQRREICLGDRTEEWAEVVSGLEEGERIVVEGAAKVKEGQRVE